MGGFSLEDLEALLGIPARTIRYWSSEGLLEGPGAGRGTRYGDEHLARLFLIQKLRAEGRPLAEIRAAIKRLSVADIRALAAQAKAEPPREPVPAKHLIRAWLHEGDARRAVAREAPGAGWVASLASALPPTPPAHWRRIPLGENVELHVQYPLSQESEALVAQLVQLAQRFAKEGSR